MNAGQGDRTAIVVGAGIGGLAAAVGLRRVGWSAIVLEQAEAIGAVGAGLSLWPNAVRALDALGVGDAARSVGVTGVSRGSMRLPSGTWLRHARPGDVPVLLLHRADLHQVLVDVLPDGSLRTGCTVTGIDDGAVRYRTGEGERTVSADVTIAADGLHSTVRQRYWPDARPPAFDGRTVWRAITEQNGSTPEASITLGRTHQFGIMPLPDQRTYWFLTASAPDRDVRYGDELAEVRRRTADWPEEIGALLAITPPDRVLHHDILALDPIDTYVRDRTALLGDAAHAQTPDLGQGACQAIEDAVVLAAALAAEPNVALALAGYDRERRPRTQAIARAAREQAAFNARHYAAMTLAARLLPQPLWRRQTARWTDWTPPVLAQ